MPHFHGSLQDAPLNALRPLGKPRLLLALARQASRNPPHLPLAMSSLRAVSWLPHRHHPHRGSPQQRPFRP
jgi:hypothetical protein